MDPNECLSQIVDTFCEQDWREFKVICDDLNEWLTKGGFVPKLKRVHLDILLTMAAKTAEIATQCKQSKT